jgi:hypothetical protein
MPRRKRWGELSKAARDRAARAGREYGLSRAAVQKRYNRGTYNPLSPDPVKRLPRELQQVADLEGNIDWAELAERNVLDKLSEYYKFNEDAVIANIYNYGNESLWRIMATATEDELITWASVQPVNGDTPDRSAFVGLPPGLTVDDVGYFTNGQWNNIFWYH